MLPRSPALILFCTLFAAAAGAPAARAGLVSLPAVGDNTIYGETTSALSNGAGDFFFAGASGSGEARRGLLRFDIAGAVPAGSTIVSADLTLHMSRSTSGPVTISLHRLLADWGEGTANAPGNEGGGAPAAPGDATWQHRFHDTAAWSTPGGDFAAGASATTLVGDIGFYAWNASSDLTNDVQTWLDDPAANFGWLLLGDESAPGTAKRFDTRENPNPTFQPVLHITYVPEPGTLTMLAFGAMAALCQGNRRDDWAGTD